MPKQKTGKSLLSLAIDRMMEGFTLINEAMGYLEEEEDMRREFFESFSQAFSSMPMGAKARRTSRKATPATNGKKNGSGRPPAEWASHALNFLEHERKCNELELLLHNLGYTVHPKTLNAFLVRKTNEGVLTRVATGRYKLSPLGSFNRF